MILDLQINLALRLVAAAGLGMLIGFERELHGHPAGMRTHLLVAMGCCLFTLVSIYGFVDAPAGTGPVDPSRLAAQVVTGIGFIGAGSIIKYGMSIRGLTTAASLWATAAVGIAVGTGEFLLAAVGTGLVLFSLAPLHWAARYVRHRHGEDYRVRLAVPRTELVTEVSKSLHDHNVVIEEIHTHRREGGGLELELQVRLPPGVSPHALLAALVAVNDVELLESDRASE